MLSAQAPSGAPLYEVVACDAFTSETKLSHLARVMALPEEPHCSDLPPLLIVNFMIPNYTPSGTMAWSEIECLFWKGPSSPPAPPRGARLVARGGVRSHGEKPAHRAPTRCLGCLR